MFVKSTWKDHFQMYLSKILLNSTANSIFYTVLLIIRIFEVIVLLEGNNLFLIFGVKMFDQNYEIHLIMTLALQILFVLILLTGLILQIRKNLVDTHQSHLQKMLRQSVCFLLLIIRLCLTIPLTYICFSSLSNNSANTALALVNLFIYYMVIYPLSGLVFWNKIITQKQLVSFSYLINIESLIFTYTPLMALLVVLLPITVPYANLVFSAFIFVCIYYHPIITLNFHRFTQFGCSVFTAVILLASVYSVLNISLTNGNQFAFFLLIIMVLTVIMAQFLESRIHSTVLNLSLQPSEGQDESMYFHLTNFHKYKSQLLILLFNFHTISSQKMPLIEKKILNEIDKKSTQYQLKQFNRQNQQKFQHTVSQFDEGLSTMKQKNKRQIKKVIIKMLNLFHSQPQNQQGLQQLYHQLVILQLKQKYDPQRLIESQLGKNQLSKQIMHFPKMYIMISQILMLKPKNLRKSYFLIKMHEQIINIIQSARFITQIQIYSLLLIVQNAIKQQKKVNKSYNMDAQFYYNFQVKFEKLKTLIFKSAETCYSFWQEMIHKQPDIEKVNKLIQKNFYFQIQIQKQTSNILLNFQRNSPVIIFDLINHYCRVVLNKPIPSLKNPYNDLLVKTKDEIQIQKKQGQSKMLIKSHMIYSLMHQIGICVIDFEKEIGNISWANEYFWQQFNNPQQVNLLKPNQKQKESILNLIIPQLRANHKYKYFNQFCQGEHINFKHQHSTIYKSKQKLIQRVIIQMQVIPSIQNGMKLLCLMRKKVKENSQFLDIIINQNYQFIACSSNFNQEKAQMFSSRQLDDKNTDLNQQICQNLLKNQNFINLLEKIKYIDKIDQSTPIINCILGMQNSDYSILLKAKYPYINENDIIVKSKEAILNKQKYLLYFELFNLIGIEPQRKKNFLPTIYYQNYNTDEFRFHQANPNLMASSLQTPFAEQSKQIMPMLKSNTLKNLNALNLPFQIAQKVLEKSEDKVMTDKKYTCLINDSTPKRIQFWRLFTIVLMLVGALMMISNIGISLNKQAVYTTSTKNIRNYNQLTTSVAKVLISLRQANYYAYQYNISDPRLPILIQQILTQQQIMYNKLTAITSILSSQWQAYLVLDSGMFSVLQESDYVVLINYVLSSVTYVSKVDLSQLAFPIIYSQYNWWQGLSPTQSNFLQSIYNGLFTCLINMRIQAINIITNIQNSITPVFNQLYILPTIGGVLILVVFTVFSVHVETKSESVRKQIVSFLQIIPQNIKQDKKSFLSHYIQQMKEKKISKSISKSKNQIPIQFETKSFGHITQNLQKTQKNTQLSNQQGQTGRELMKMEFSINDNQMQQKQQNTIQVLAQKKPRKRSSISPQTVHTSYSSIKMRVIFYLIICLPFFTYFCVIFVSGIMLNNSLMALYTVGSQIYARKTNYQNIYLFTRETALYQSNVLGVVDWTKRVIGEVQQSYARQLQISNSLQQLSSDSSVVKFLKSIQSSNLCNSTIQQFPPSTYYNTTFNLSQCSKIAQSILTKGLRSLIVYYFQTAIELLSRYPQPGTMNYSSRIAFIESDQLIRMKTFLIYLQQINDISTTYYQQDVTQLINSYMNMTIIYSIVSGVAVLSIFVAIQFRWKILIKQRKQIKSIISLISFTTIKLNLLKQFDKLDVQFYE